MDHEYSSSTEDDIEKNNGKKTRSLFRSLSIFQKRLIHSILLNTLHGFLNIQLKKFYQTI